MGGKLLKSWELPEYRMNAEEFNQYSSELIEIFNEDLLTDKYKFDNYRNIIHTNYIQIPAQIRSKSSFGDIDILIGIDDFKGPIWYLGGNNLTTTDYILEKFGVRPHVNDSVYSFPYKGVQVDMCFYSREDFHSALNYMAHSDASNLLGRVFHKMGLHFGHTGLSFWIRQGMFDNNVTWSDNDHIYEKVILTKNMEDICEIGGFDYAKWVAGFDTNEEVYRFVAESEYFKKELFAFENLNHINRVRNKKRPMYAAFVEWLETTNPDESGKKEFLDKSTYALIYQKRFPHLQTAISKYYFEYNVTKCLKSKLNGRIIMDVLGTEDGRTVGQIMSAIKKEFTTMELIGKTESEIRIMIQYAYIISNQS